MSAPQQPGNNPHDLEAAQFAERALQRAIANSGPLQPLSAGTQVAGDLQAFIFPTSDEPSSLVATLAGAVPWLNPECQLSRLPQQAQAHYIRYYGQLPQRLGTDGRTLRLLYVCPYHFPPALAGERPPHPFLLQDSGYSGAGGPGVWRPIDHQLSQESVNHWWGVLQAGNESYLPRRACPYCLLTRFHRVVDIQQIQCARDMRVFGYKFSIRNDGAILGEPLAALALVHYVQAPTCDCMQQHMQPDIMHGWPIAPMNDPYLFRNLLRWLANELTLEQMTTWRWLELDETESIADYYQQVHPQDYQRLTDGRPGPRGYWEGAEVSCYCPPLRTSVRMTWMMPISPVEREQNALLRLDMEQSSVRAWLYHGMRWMAYQQFQILSHPHFPLGILQSATH